MPMSSIAIMQVSSALSACGVPLPREADDAAKVFAALKEEAQRDIVAEALAAATDSPLTAKNAAKRVSDLAIALISRDRAAEAAQHYEGLVLDQFRRAIVENIDDLIVAMRPQFNPAAEVLHTAGIMFEPGTRVAATDGMAAVETYLALDQAKQTLRAVNSARVQITKLAGYAEPDATWYLESAEDNDDLARARVLWKHGAHHLTHAGYRLRLNTRAEAEAVASNAARGTATATASQQRARAAANRDPLREAVIAHGLGR